jgi:ribosome biogenesis protein Nip4
VLSGNFDSRHEKGLVLVQNNLDENLGLGRITQEKGQTILKNILDRGNYLRHKKVRLWV